MIDVDRIAKAKTDIIRVHDQIKSHFSIGINEYVADVKAPMALKYLLIEAVEAISDVCQHLLAKEKGIPCEGYIDCIIKAGKEGILTQVLADRLRRLADLRNIIVHRYWKVDDRQIYTLTMQNKDDLIEFVREVDVYISSLSPL